MSESARVAFAGRVQLVARHACKVSETGHDVRVEHSRPGGIRETTMGTSSLFSRPLPAGDYLFQPGCLVARGAHPQLRQRRFASG